MKEFTGLNMQLIQLLPPNKIFEYFLPHGQVWWARGALFC